MLHFIQKTSQLLFSAHRTTAFCMKSKIGLKWLNILENKIFELKLTKRNSRVRITDNEKKRDEEMLEKTLKNR